MIFFGNKYTILFAHCQAITFYYLILSNDFSFSVEQGGKFRILFRILSFVNQGFS
jgi:hypothetical protein